MTSPWPLRKHLTGHEVLSAYHRGWHQKKNNELLNLAEADGFDLLVTCDASMRFQQQVIGRKIGVLALTQTNWPLVERHVLKIAEAVNEMTVGSSSRVDHSDSASEGLIKEFPPCI
jgi:hypothetical protein